MGRPQKTSDWSESSAGCLGPLGGSAPFFSASSAFRMPWSYRTNLFNGCSGAYLRNFKGGGGGVWRNFLQNGGPTTYSEAICIAKKPKKGGPRPPPPPQSAPASSCFSHHFFIYLLLCFQAGSYVQSWKLWGTFKKKA